MTEMETFNSFQIFENLIDAVAIFDANRVLIFANEAFANLTSIPARQLLKNPSLDDTITFQPDEFMKELDFPKLQVSSPYSEVNFVSKTGMTGRVQVSIQPILNQGNKVFLAFIHDVTLEKILHSKYHAEFREKDKKISQISLLLQVSNALTGVHDPESVFRDILEKLVEYRILHSALYLGDLRTNQNEVTLFSKGKQNHLEPQIIKVIPDLHSLFRSFQGTERTAALPPESRSALLNQLAPALKTHNEVGNIVILPFGMKKGAIQTLLFLHQDNSESVDQGDLDLLQSIAAQATIALDSYRFFESSITDEMTNLFNKRYFMSRIENELARTSRTNESLSLVIFDADHFKKVNDTYGHQTGDLVLQEIAKVAKTVCRSYDMAARYGGEEFVLVLPRTDNAEAFMLAERLRKSVESLGITTKDHQSLKVTISCGVATFPSQCATVEDLISLADKALYFSKKTGRNRSTIYFMECESQQAA